MTGVLLTVGEAATRLRCSKYTVRRRLREGDLTGVKAGKHGHWRIPERSIDEFIEAHSNAAVSASRGRS